MSAATIVILIGVILVFLSALPVLSQGVSLWNLGWGFVLLGYLVIGKGTP